MDRAHTDGSTRGLRDRHGPAWAISGGRRDTVRYISSRVKAPPGAIDSGRKHGLDSRAAPPSRPGPEIAVEAIDPVQIPVLIPVMEIRSLVINVNSLTKPKPKRI